jgi:transposase
MKKVQHIIGADLSKKSIDLACYLSSDHICINNSAPGFKEMVRWIRKQKINPTQLMIVMEHTGLYSYRFEDFLHQYGIAFTKINALAIKRSLGLVRGKSDKIDAFRIALYGYEKRDRLLADKQTDDQLKRLKLLHSTRDRLTRQRAGLLCAVNEYRHIGIPEKDLLLQSQLQMIKNFDRQIEKLETEMQNIVKANQSLMQTFSLLQSVKGVGPVLAMTTLIKTQNFTRFTNARKFACFCGTAPFEHSSGTSVKGKTRVSHLADKRMKTLLSLSAESAIQHDKELREYYLKRTQSGKSKMNALNVVRNKILYRMFAVVQRQTPFIENFLNAA